MGAEKISGVETLLGIGSEFKGQVTVKGNIRIDGRLEGNITSEEGIVVGEKGYIKGNLTSKNILVSGKVFGNVVAYKRLEILPTGHLEGDIKTQRIAIAEGVVFKGNCDMGFDKEDDMLLESSRSKK